MVKVLLVKKTGTIKLDNYNHENDEQLYKVAGLKSKEDFECVATWNVFNENNNLYDYCVYAKKIGKAGQENKYDFPPPIDYDLYFGSCIILKKNNESYKSLRLEEWEYIYENLFGGFEDLGDEDTDDEGGDDELDDDVEFTKSGYVQDDFIVDDDFDEEEEEEEDYDDDTVEVNSVDATTSSSKYNTRSNKKVETVFQSLDQDFDSELTE